MRGRPSAASSSGTSGDKRWQIHVKRPVQELVLQVREATGPLAQELGRTPADSDLARHLGVSGG
jgi:RNA polymerase sigma-B factor